MSKRNKSEETLEEPVYLPLNGELDFERALSLAINEGLTSISTIVAPVLRAYLDDAVTYEIGHMKPRSTIKDVRALQKSLEKMFGFGAKVFEKKILDALYAKLSLDLETGHDFVFSDAVKEARKIYETKMWKTNASRKGRYMLRAKSGGARKN